MVKNKLLLLLVLLVAVSGAWAADGIECSASDKGKVICTDGSIYENVSAATTAGKTAVAMIAYIDMENKNGLALALSDEGSMTWSEANSACAGKSAVAGGTWVLPSKEQWEAMGAKESNSTSATALRDGFSSVGGTNMQSGAYWSSTENSTNVNKAYRYYFTNGYYWENNVNKTVNNYVRACLTFNILVAPPTYSVTLAEGTEDGDKWTIEPKTGLNGGETVTATYKGEKKVKSVKAVKKGAPAPAPATITVTWNGADITGTGGGTSFTKDGVTITDTDIEFMDKNFLGGGTFTTTLGNFTKIEVTTEGWYASGTGWSGSTWTGTPASSVSFSGEIMGYGGDNLKFVFTIEPTN